MPVLFPFSTDLLLLSVHTAWCLMLPYGLNMVPYSIVYLVGNVSRIDRSSSKPGSARIKSTVTVPAEWVPKIREFMERMGFQDYAELFRYLIRKEIIGSGR